MAIDLTITGKQDNEVDPLEALRGIAVPARRTGIKPDPLEALRGVALRPSPRPGYGQPAMPAGWGPSHEGSAPKRPLRSLLPRYYLRKGDVVAGYTVSSGRRPDVWHNVPGVFDIGGVSIRARGKTVPEVAAEFQALGFVTNTHLTAGKNSSGMHLHVATPGVTPAKVLNQVRSRQAMADATRPFKTPFAMERGMQYGTPPPPSKVEKKVTGAVAKALKTAKAYVEKEGRAGVPETDWRAQQAKAKKSFKPYLGMGLGSTREALAAMTDVERQAIQNDPEVQRLAEGMLDLTLWTIPQTRPVAIAKTFGTPVIHDWKRVIQTGKFENPVHTQTVQSLKAMGIQPVYAITHMREVYKRGGPTAVMEAAFGIAVTGMIAHGAYKGVRGLPGIREPAALRPTEAANIPEGISITRPKQRRGPLVFPPVPEPVSAQDQAIIASAEARAQAKPFVGRQETPSSRIPEPVQVFPPAPAPAAPRPSGPGGMGVDITPVLQPIPKPPRSLKRTGLTPLIEEARKYPDFESFSHDYQLEIKHGRYWHVTDNPKFGIDLTTGPRDMSSLARGEITPGQLMTTSHLEYWLAEYPERKYVAELDLSRLSPKDYYQVNRGFGNEFMLTPEGTQKARVVKVYTREAALRADKAYYKLLPQSKEALQRLYEEAHGLPAARVSEPVVAPSATPRPGGPESQGVGITPALQQIPKPPRAPRAPKPEAAKPAPVVAEKPEMKATPKPSSPKFYVKYTEEPGKFVEVKGKSVTIPGHEDMDAFIHRPLSQLEPGTQGTVNWTVSDGRFGGMLGEGLTQKEALDNATAKFNRVSAERVREVFEDALTRYGESPRYAPPATTPTPAPVAAPKPKPIVIKPTETIPTVTDNLLVTPYYEGTRILTRNGWTLPDDVATPQGRNAATDALANTGMSRENIAQFWAEYDAQTTTPAKGPVAGKEPPPAAPTVEGKPTQAVPAVAHRAKSGDFYEFPNPPEELVNALGLSVSRMGDGTLTVGVPNHAIDSAMKTLSDAGIKVVTHMSLDQAIKSSAKAKSGVVGTKPAPAAEAVPLVTAGKPSFAVDADGNLVRIVGWDGKSPQVVYPGNKGGKHLSVVGGGTVLEAGRPYEYILPGGEWRPATAQDFLGKIRPGGSQYQLDLRAWRDEFAAEVRIAAENKYAALDAEAGKASRRPIIEARLARGESVPQQYLDEFPDLAAKYASKPEAAPVEPGRVGEAKTAVEPAKPAEPGRVRPSQDPARVAKLEADIATVKKFWGDETGTMDFGKIDWSAEPWKALLDTAKFYAEEAKWVADDWAAAMRTSLGKKFAEQFPLFGDKLWAEVNRGRPEEPGRLGEPGERGISRARIEAERTQLGLKPIDVQPFRAKVESYSEGKAAVDSGEIDVRAVAQEIADNPRPATAVENGAFAYVRDQINAAQKTADLARSNELSALDELIQTGARRGGREWGATGQSLQHIGEEIEPLTLGDVLARARQNKGGKDLTQAELDRYRKLQTGYEQAKTEADRLSAENEKLQKSIADQGAARESNEALSQQLKEAERLLSKAKKPRGPRAARPEFGVGNVLFTREMKHAADDYFGRQSSVLKAGLDPEAIGHLVNWMGYEIEATGRAVYWELRTHFLAEYPTVDDALVQAAYKELKDSDRLAGAKKQYKTRIANTKEIKEAGVSLGEKPPPFEKDPEYAALKKELHTLRADVIEHGGMEKRAVVSQKKSEIERQATIASRLKVRIADVQERIEKRIPPEERLVRVPDTPKIAADRQRLRGLEAEHRRILGLQEKGPRGTTEAQRLAMAERAVAKRIAEVNRRLAENELIPEKRPPSYGASTKLMRDREILRGLNEKLQRRLETEHPEYVERQRLEDWRKQNATRLKELDAQIAIVQAGGTLPPKPVRYWTQETLQARAAFEDKRNALRQALKPKATATEIGLNIARTGLSGSTAWQAAWDNSVLFLQGVRVLLHDPKAWGVAARDSFRAMFSEPVALMIDDQIVGHKFFSLAQQSGVEHTSLSRTAPYRATEEMATYMRMGENIPILGKALRPFDRAFTTGGNLLRHEPFYRMAEAKGKGWTLERYKNYGRFLNILARRAPLGKAGVLQPYLNTVMISVRGVASDWIMPTQLVSKDPYIRMATAKQLVKETAAVVSLAYALRAAGVAVGLDPGDRKTFLQAQFGKTRIGLVPGQARTAMTTAWAIGEAMFDASRWSKEKPKYGQRLAHDVAWGYFNTKAPGGTQTLKMLWTGKDWKGDDISTVQALLHGVVVPWNVDDVADAWQLEGPLMATAVAAATFLGIPAQTYEPRKRRRSPVTGVPGVPGMSGMPAMR